MLTLEQVREIVSNMDSDDGDCACSTFNNNVMYYLTIVEEPSFVSDGKYEYGYAVYELVYEKDKKYIGTGFFIGQGIDRSGSYYTDYEYGYDKFEIVKKVKKVIEVEEWERIV